LNDGLLQLLKDTDAVLRRWIDLLEGQRSKPVKGVVLLLECTNTSWEFRMAKSKKGLVAIPNFTMAELASKGALIQLFDAGDNPTPLPTTPYTSAWTSADATVLTVTPSSTDPSQATVASTGKIGADVSITCILHATDTPPSFADLDCACTVTVPAGPPTQGTIAIAP
jgi:hypothetical protein